MKILNNTAAALLCCCTLNSCSYLDIGDSEFSCPGRSRGVICAGTREIYNRTHNGSIPVTVAPEEAAKKRDSAAGTVYAGEGGGSGRPDHGVITSAADEHQEQIRDNYIIPNLPDQPIPVRTPAGVMRIWLAPWEDLEGDLHVSGYIYTEIEPRRWVIAEPEDLHSSGFNSLN
ncbi:MAG: type IV conjugative transfer system lipoprotein TraV [Succinivibrionaceae bacterium]|nr:type IV conjugative transfer system lipoprotein TraV [Succinivibrionaceae bacterium]